MIRLLIWRKILEKKTKEESKVTRWPWLVWLAARR